jgi:ribosome biogenesis GTPase
MKEELTSSKRTDDRKSDMFSGHSGVGKSTLVVSWNPRTFEENKVISEASKQGQHTTTFTL